VGVNRDALQRGFAEFVGAFALVFVCAGSIIATKGLTAIALAHGLAIGVMASAVGHIWYLGPVLGAVLAALAYEWLYLRPLSPESVGPPETGVEEPAPGQAAPG
jgi:glycerol uptake facilitator-like aquaporin